MADGRSLGVIAAEIRKEWKPVHPAAKPYLDTMITLRSVDQDYYGDSGRSIVSYFLANAGTWRGESARRIKAELNRLLK
jgi:hypothetical protein